MISRSVTIVNKLGLHARAATRLVNCASVFEAELLIRNGDKTINGKSIMGVLTLAACKGTVLVIEAEGPDRKEALQAMCELINDRFGEDE
ncbi:MAG: HPr family phosphocarrier protein [Xanthomonadales bacterium]